MPPVSLQQSCWKVTSAERGAFLVDAEAYYRNLYHALSKARHSVWLLGWDINSHVLLLPDVPDSPTLGVYFKSLLQEREDLDIYILIWDFYVLAGLDREFFARIKFNWGGSARIHFMLDHEHPLGASHHQKVAVIDDQIAFCGGLDLTASRWDTSQHLAHNKYRRDPGGKFYEPTHDIQMMVQGRAASMLGVLARERWHRVSPHTGKELYKRRHVRDFDALEWQFGPSTIGICRTDPAYKHRRGVHEIEKTSLAIIKAARRHIYIENQYFSSRKIARAIRARLREKNGPEVTMVLSEHGTGWLEQETLFAMGDAHIAELKKVDRYGRFAAFYPRIKGHSCLLKIHSKILIADDTYAMVGSANFSNRSMGMDTECNLVLDATGNPSLKGHVTRLRAQLIAEHTRLSPAEIMRRYELGESLNEVICAADHRHGLVEIVPKSSLLINTYSIHELTDMEKPLQVDQVLDALGVSLLHRHTRVFVSWPMVTGIVLGILLLFFILWNVTPLSEVFSLPALKDYFTRFDSALGQPLWVIVLYVVGGILFVPVNFLILATATVFDVWTALFYIVIGSAANALVVYFLGFFVGRRFVERIFYARTSHIAEKIQERSILSMMLLRLFPVAPYSVVNVIAGALKIKVFPYLIGSILGILPGAVLLVFFQKSLLGVLKEPDAVGILILVGMVLLFVVLGVGIKRRFSNVKP